MLQAGIDWFEGFDEMVMTGEEYIDAGRDQVIARVRQAAHGEHSGVPVEADFWFVWTLHNAKITGLDMYMSKAQALEAAGLPEEAMSRENVENFLQAVEAFNRKDADAFVALASPEVKWEDAMFSSGVSQTHRGRDELREWLNEVEEAWESIHVEVEEITEAGDDRAFAELFLTGRGAGSGVETELRVWQVNWFVDGKTARRQVFLERAEALEAAGLTGVGRLVSAVLACSPHRGIPSGQCRGVCDYSGARNVTTSSAERVAHPGQEDDRIGVGVIRIRQSLHDAGGPSDL